MTPCIVCDKARVNKSSFTECLSTSFAKLFGPRLKYMFEQTLKLSLHNYIKVILINAFQVLKCFLLLLDVTCVIFARMINTDVWQAIVASHLKCSDEGLTLETSACKSLYSG